MLRLYDYQESGNGYKVRLLLHQLDLRYERIELDILQGESRTPGFLALNPNGRIPLLVLEDGDVYGVADIALFAYTHVAGEGGFALARYPAVTAWLERVRAQPRHIPITAA